MGILKKIIIKEPENEQDEQERIETKVNKKDASIRNLCNDSISL